MGKDNVVADLLSGWTGSAHDYEKLHSHVRDPLWLQVTSEYLELDNIILS